jgi:hypothetical protein
MRLQLISTEGEKIQMVKRTMQAMRSRLTAIIILSGLALLLTTSAHGGTMDEGFSVKEYEHFHHVLHPLQHDALPKNDFKRIRAAMGDLMTLGEAILNLGVPEGVEEKNSDEFKAGLVKFGEALNKFKADARNGTDEQLKASYNAVHDSFEMLAALLPKKQ